jgi:hypothetical protein
MLKRRTLFWVGIVLLLLGGLFLWGLYLYNKPHRSAADAPLSATIAADSLFAQYQRDEHRADSLYGKGKVIEVTGSLLEIQHSGNAEIWILSAGDSSAATPGGGINCQLFSADKDPSPLPKPGDKVTIKGKCTGFLMDVNLSDCVPE